MALIRAGVKALIDPQDVYKRQGYLFINIINQQVEINLSIADNSHYVK